MDRDVIERSKPYVRPGPVLSRLVNPIMVRLGLTTTLVVPGRRSGKTLRVPLGRPFEMGPRRFLVSGRGNTHWVRNLRAAGGGELRFHGKTEAFRAVELTGAKRDEVVTAYRTRLGHSVDRYFAEIPDPADHPVFEIEQLPSRPAEPKQ